jgi:hypothetical protein
MCVEVLRYKLFSFESFLEEQTPEGLIMTTKDKSYQLRTRTLVGTRFAMQPVCNSAQAHALRSKIYKIKSGLFSPYITVCTIVSG